MCGPQNSQTSPPCYVFLIQIIEGNCIFNNSLAKFANMVQDQKVDKHTPPSRGGLTSTPPSYSIPPTPPSLHPSLNVSRLIAGTEFVYKSSRPFNSRLHMVWATSIGRRSCLQGPGYGNLGGFRSYGGYGLNQKKGSFPFALGVLSLL